MKTTSFILALIISISIGKAQTNHQVSYFSLQDVKLLDSPFLQAQQTDLHYILALDPDRLSAPFLREAGLTPKAPSYTNWENTGLDGHIGGHYLSALSMMYASTGDTVIYNRLNYMLNGTTPCTASCRHRIYRRNTRKPPTLERNQSR